MTRWIDAHCHLQWDEIDSGAMSRAIDAGVEKFICIGTDAETSKQAIEIAATRPDRVHATVGLHPHDATHQIDSVKETLQWGLKNYPGSVVGIGECGLDYFYEHSPRNIQRQIFASQIEIAVQNDLTLVIHTRDAWKDTFEILREVGVPPRTVLHCFTGSSKELQTCLELGLYISFSGIVTFKKAEKVLEAALICPLERMTIETDSPYLAPTPHRGKPNEPAHLTVIGRFLSEKRGMQVEEFAELVSGNTEDLFNLR